MQACTQAPCELHPSAVIQLRKSPCELHPSAVIQLRKAHASCIQVPSYNCAKAHASCVWVSCDCMHLATNRQSACVHTCMRIPCTRMPLPANLRGKKLAGFADKIEIAYFRIRLANRGDEKKYYTQCKWWHGDKVYHQKQSKRSNKQYRLGSPTTAGQGTETTKKEGNMDVHKTRQHPRLHNMWRHS